MAHTICSVEGCDRAVLARGLCGPHYHRKRRHGDVLAHIPVTAVMRWCRIPGCDEPAAVRDLCNAHHQRWVKHGDVRADVPIQKKHRHYRGQLCSVDGCGRPARNKGLCGVHFQRLWKTGDVQADKPIKTPAPAGSGSEDGRGYRWLTVDGKSVLEHRHVMAQMLGRPLETGETVHHLNGNRLDNRPRNLELWSTMQPKGQRIEDKIAWARQIIDLYGDDFVQPRLLLDRRSD